MLRFNVNPTHEDAQAFYKIIHGRRKLNSGYRGISPQKEIRPLWEVEEEEMREFR